MIATMTMGCGFCRERRMIADFSRAAQSNEEDAESSRPDS
jgi:hypothetical protein